MQTLINHKYHKNNFFIHKAKILQKMGKAILLAAIMATLNAALATPLNKPLPPTTPTSEIDLFANVTAPTCTTNESEPTINNGLIDPRFRWQNFNVHPDRAYDSNERVAINNAMYNLMQVIPCVRFGIWPPESNPTGDYVRIIKGNNNGCNSNLGKRGGSQNMNLQSPGCMSMGTIMHEMIHALGYGHEQSRPDRDDYVNIHLGNIQDGKAHNFDKLSASEFSTFGVPYNTRSIMHYGSHDFSKNGQPTITAKNGGPVGSQGILQQTDMQKLKNMYRC